MRNTTKGFNRFLAMTLSMAMLTAELPMTVSAAQAEGVVEETYMDTEPLTENEKTPLTDTENESSEELVSETENDVQTETSSEDAKESIESAVSQEETIESESVDESTDAEEEQTEITESAADLTVSSASDFVISNGVLTGYTGTDENVVIPEGVVTIKADAFKNNTTIKTVRFSSTVTTIERSAFYNCSSLVSVNLNEGLATIGREAFYGTALGEKLSTGAVKTGTLTIPSTVQRIEDLAFSNCAYLGTITFADGDTEVLTIDDSYYYGAFSSCPELTKVVLPSRLTKIPSKIFTDNKKLNEVVLGEKVETIGEDAFYNCISLKSINWPSTVKTIGESAFKNCASLVSVDLKEGLETIGREAFYGVAFGEKLSTGAVETGTLTIPSTVQRIEDLAFSNCAYLG
ncbi:MAG: leucine-rich repeat protein, partial [Lachnospiraceae bacterium]|nr:leucine-rich repeat protein [Lachnospiraceae bacterium]